MQPIDFCPASATADVIARIEGCAELVDQMIAKLRNETTSEAIDMLISLETLQLDLSMESDRARTRLAELDAVSPAGVIAQLLAAVYDLRIGDDEECARAKRLESRAVNFLRTSTLLNPADAIRLSQTQQRVAEVTPYEESRVISSSEMS